MYKDVLGIAVILLVGFLATPSAANEVSQVDTSKAIAEIKRQYQKTWEQSDSLEMLHTNIFGESSQGGDLAGYFDKQGMLRKMRLKLYGETGQMTEEYYLDNHSVFFLFGQGIGYDRPWDEPDMKMVDTVESRYYITDGKLIQWLDSKRGRIDPRKEPYEEKLKQILSGAERYKQIIIAEKQKRLTPKEK
jgi:hypothetical protein